jgi:Kef-type K+ transport system membrane component KefB
MMEIDSIAVALITLGAIFLASLAADLLGRRTQLPRVTLLLLLGVCVGPLGFDVLPDWGESWFPFIADLALVMIAFLLGGDLTRPVLRKYGATLLIASLAVSLATIAVVGSGLLLLGWPAATALALAAVATATDPAAVGDVAREAKARGPFTKALLGIVAVDDAWGIVAMSFALTLILGMQSPGSLLVIAGGGLLDLAGAVALGCLLGVPMAFLTGRVRSGEPTQAEALGGVLLCGGLALLLDVSILLAPMAMGVVVANLARHHRRPFRAIEGIEWPMMVLFFVLCGASLRPTSVGDTAALTVAFVVLRVLGRIGGGYLGARFSGRPEWAVGLGMSLFPQAGVAIGMALVLSERVPSLGSSILSATLSGTILFELVGPILTRWSLRRSGETQDV